nr:hypothetical protein [Tanacetum cinerariifolium]
KQSTSSEFDAKTSDLDSCDSSFSEETLETMPKPVESKPKVVNEPQVWSDAPIIEEYESDSDDKYVSKASVEQEKPNQDRATIAKSSTLPRYSVPRVTSPAAEEGSMQQTLNELTDFCTSLQRQHLELLAKFQAQEVEINRLKERVKYLEDKKGEIGDKSGDDAPIKGRRSNEGETAAEKNKH